MRDGVDFELACRNSLNMQTEMNFHERENGLYELLILDRGTRLNLIFAKNSFLHH